MPRAALIPLFLLLCLFRLTYAFQVPLTVINSPDDDLLYVNHAAHLVHEGNYGPYSPRTFLKLPGYSLYLAAASQSGLPYRLCLELTFLGSLALLLHALLQWGISPVISIGAIASAAFNPWTLSREWYFVMREPLSVCLHLCWFSGLLALWQRARIDSWVPLTGLALGALTLLREEDTALIFFQIALTLVCYVWRDRDHALRLALPLLAVPLLWSAVRLTHHHWYGLASIHQLSDGNYPSLLATLRRVKPQTNDLHLFLDAKAENAIRSIHPALGEALRRAQQRRPPNDPGTLMFRLAEEMPTLYPNLTASRADRIFAQWTEELNHFCSTATLDCLPASPSWLPVPTPTSIFNTVAEVELKIRGLIQPALTAPNEPLEFGPLSPAAVAQHERVLNEAFATNPLKAQEGGGRLRSLIALIFQLSLRWHSLIAVFGFVVFAFRLFQFGWSRKHAAGNLSVVGYSFIAGKIFVLGYVSQYLSIAGRVGYPLQLLVGTLGTIVLIDSAEIALRKFRPLRVTTQVGVS